jgi:hypothetical protein
MPLNVAIPAGEMHKDAHKVDVEMRKCENEEMLK